LVKEHPEESTDSSSRKKFADTLLRLVPEDMRPEHWTLKESGPQARPWWIPQFPREADSWDPPFWWLSDPSNPKVDADRSVQADSSQHDELPRSVIREFGQGASEKFDSYLECSQSGDRFSAAVAYLAFLDELPKTESVLAEMVQSVIDSKSTDEAWAESWFTKALDDPRCPLWLKAAGAFGCYFDETWYDSPHIQAERVVLSHPGPASALVAMSWLVPSFRLNLVPSLPSPEEQTGVFFSDEGLWIHLLDGLADRYIEVVTSEPIWGGAPWVGLAGEFEEGERPALICAAAIVGWLLDRSEDGDAREVLPLLCIAVRYLIDLLASHPLSLLLLRDAVGLFDSLVLDMRDLVTSDSFISDYTTIEPDAFDQTIHSAAALFGALQLIAVSRAEWKVADLAEPLASLVASLPADDLLGGQSGPEAVIARMDALQADVARRLEMPVREPAQATRERGQVLLRKNVERFDEFKWEYDKDLTYAFGMSADTPDFVVARERGAAVEAVLHRVVPELAATEHFSALADNFRSNFRKGSTRLLTADEGRSWIPLLQMAQSTYNLMKHRNAASPSESDFAFWLPDRFPVNASRYNVFDLLDRLADLHHRNLEAPARE